MSSTILVFISLVALATAGDWSYNAGAKGPENWASVAADCGGSSQSPIDINMGDAKYDKNLKPFEFKNYAAPISAQYHMSNSHSLKLNFNTSGVTAMPAISGGGLVGDYEFLQFHFHWGSTSAEGSEHTLSSQAYPAELHIVHMNTKYPTFNDAIGNADGLAVLGIMVDVGEEDNPVFADMISNIGSIAYSGDEVPVDSFAFDAVLPDDDLDVFFRYPGSLTTPGCYEIVQWTVFKEPIFMSEAQLQIMRSGLKDSKLGETDDPLVSNYRPVQPLNTRKVTTSMKPMDADDAANSITLSAITMATTLLCALFFKN